MTWDMYVRFVRERHKIWMARHHGKPQPWTTDLLLATRKFTNTFRILDPGTQFAVRELPHPDPVDELMRLFLYRHTGWIPAWTHLHNMVGAYPTRDTLEDARMVWGLYRARDNRVFTGAYNIFPQGAGKGSDKLDAILDLTHRLFVTLRAGERFLDQTTQAGRFQELRRHSGVGDFMAMQVLTDWGYTSHCGEDRENDFIVAGPGAVKGAAHVDPTRRAEDVIEESFLYWREDGMVAIPGLGRTPSLMDVQNTMCEFGKYMKLRPGSKLYSPAHPGQQTTPFYPPHW